MEEKQTLSEFLENRMSVYYNPADVDFYLNKEGSLFVCCDYPGVEQRDNIYLELFQEVKTVDTLMKLLHISSIEEIDAITAGDLMTLYEKEEMNIVCTLDGTMPREMSFRKYKKLLWAKNTNEEIHQVKKQIQQPEDFINYTLNYYESNLVKHN